MLDGSEKNSPCLKCPRPCLRQFKLQTNVRESLSFSGARLTSRRAQIVNSRPIMRYLARPIHHKLNDGFRAHLAPSESDPPRYRGRGLGYKTRFERLDDKMDGWMRVRIRSQQFLRFERNPSSALPLHRTKNAKCIPKSPTQNPEINSL